jgi:hypothetical protein
MSVGIRRHILTLSNTQAKGLAGSALTIDGETYFFKDYEAAYPGQPPWRSGAEGKAYPLLDIDDSVTAYLKFFTRPTSKRLHRTAWLISQEMHTWLPNLAAAPLLWADSRLGQRARGTELAFAGYLARAVPGRTWLELKTAIADVGVSFPDDLRWRCVQDLILALAVLEDAGIVHGDLSPNNIVVNLDAQPHEPVLYLIDFDAFVAPAAGVYRVVTVAEGGTYGTEGYCPPELATQAGAGDMRVAPYSDRYGRDMLLMELLFMDCAMSPDDPPSRWASDQLQRRYAAWRARSDSRQRQALAYLAPSSVFAMGERQRPTSAELAAALELSLPGGRQLRPLRQPWRPTPAMLNLRPLKPKTRAPQRQSRAVSAGAQRPSQWATGGTTCRASIQQSRPQYQQPDFEHTETIIVVFLVALALSPWIGLLAYLAGDLFR